jgi:hypothetical protein
MRGTLTELHWSRAVQYFDAVGMLLWAADAAFAASVGQSIGGPALMAALLAKPQLVGMQALWPPAGPRPHRAAPVAHSLLFSCTLGRSGAAGGRAVTGGTPVPLFAQGRIVLDDVGNKEGSFVIRNVIGTTL